MPIDNLPDQLRTGNVSSMPLDKAVQTNHDQAKFSMKQLMVQIKSIIEIAEKEWEGSFKSKKQAPKRLTLDQVTSDSAKFAVEFECPICTNIVESMVCCSECETNFCKDCISSWVKKNPLCPSCREASTYDNKVPRKL